MTTVADGLFQYGGVPVGMGLDWANIYATRRNGRTWFVDANYGADGNNGKSWENALLTMDAAFDRVASGDLIYFTGKIQEQLVTPVQVFDVSVIGMGNRPRHADSTPSGGQYATAQWAPPSSGVAAQATVRVLQQGWRFQNILFTAVDADAACVEVVRNAASGNDERDGSHCVIRGCRGSGAGIGVRLTATSFTENPFNVLIEGNKFNSMTYGILASAAQPNSCIIRGNVFQGTTNAITAKLQASLIISNVIQGFTAAANSGGIDLTGGVAGNVVTLNYLGGTYSNAGGYVAAGAGDEWGGNMNSLTGGWTAADPA